MTTQSQSKLKVAHNLHDFNQDEEYELVLEDRGFLDNGDEAEALLNPNISSAQRTKELLRQKLNKAKVSPELIITYQANSNTYQQEFDDFGIPIQKDILPQYSQQQKVSLLFSLIYKKIEGILLDSDGIYDPNQTSSSASTIRQRLNKNLQKISLETSLNFQSDTMAPKQAPVAKFKRPKASISLQKRKAAESLESLNQLVNSGAQEVSTRAERNTEIKAQNDAHEKLRKIKRDNFDKAVYGDNEIFDDVEDEYQKDFTNRAPISNQDKFKLLFEKNLEMPPPPMKETNENIKEKQKRNDGEAELISDTSELMIMETDKERQEREKILMDTANFGLQSHQFGTTSSMPSMADLMKSQVSGMTSVINSSAKNQQQIKTERQKIIETEYEDLLTREVKEEDKNLIENITAEPLVGKGIGNALQVFRQRGMLGDSNKFYIGRQSDKNYDAEMKKHSAQTESLATLDERLDSIYTDKFGQKQSQKQAFREMCWKMHGRMPSHRKLEKAKAKEEKERLGEMGRIQGAMKGVEGLKEAQRRQKTVGIAMSLSKAIL